MGGLVIDYVVIFGGWFLLVFVLLFGGMVVGVVNPGSAEPLWLGLLIAPCYLMYYFYFEAVLGRTLGKMLMGTYVVNYEGGQPTFMTVLKRTLARLIPCEYVTFLGGPTSGLHDRLSRTYVVRKVN